MINDGDDNYRDQREESEVAKMQGQMNVELKEKYVTWGWCTPPSSEFVIASPSI